MYKLLTYFRVQVWTSWQKVHSGSSTCLLEMYPSPCVHHSNQGCQEHLHAAAKRLLPPAMHGLPCPQPMPAHPQEQHSSGPPATTMHAYLVQLLQEQ